MRHTGTQRFETERLICRMFVYEDWQDMLNNWAGDETVQREYGEPAYTTEADVKELLKGYFDGYKRGDLYRWAVIEKKSGANVGQIAFCRVYPEKLTAEIEYCIGRAFQGRGYAGEALAGLISHIFANTEFEKLEAYHRIENISSGKVLARSDMQVTDSVERFTQAGIQPHGEVCYCIIKPCIDENTNIELL